MFQKIHAKFVFFDINVFQIAFFTQKNQKSQTMVFFQNRYFYLFICSNNHAFVKKNVGNSQLHSGFSYDRKYLAGVFQTKHKILKLVVF